MRYGVPLAFFLILVSLIASPAFSNSAIAATFELTWADNSSDETGFRVERKLGATGAYGVIVTTDANVTSYNDSNLADSTTYCYRVNAFNDAGNSPYSPEVCGTTAIGVRRRTRHRDAASRSRLLAKEWQRRLGRRRCCGLHKR